jgi:uncharacterized protein YaeQ
MPRRAPPRVGSSTKSSTVRSGGDDRACCVPRAVHIADLPAGVARAIVRAPTTVLHRFQIALADVDRSVYTDLDVRVARHPSEDVPFLLTRVLAFALEHTEGLEFGKGLSDADEPAVWQRAGDGRVLTWIDVGSPAPDRLHRAAKLGARVVVYCHKRPDLLRQRCAKENVHRADEIVVVEVPSNLLDALGERLDRNNRWDLSRHEGHVTVVAGGEAIDAVLPSGPLVPPT